MPRLVLRTAEEWYVGDPLGVGSTAAALREVLASVASSDAHVVPSARFGLAVTARERVELTPEVVVSPVPVWAGVMTGGRVLIEDRHGSVLLLDGDDLRLLDLLDRPMCVADLLARVPLASESASARLERLASAGCVRIGQASIIRAGSGQGPVGPSPEESAPGELPSRVTTVSQRVLTAYRLSSKLQPVRELLGRMSGGRPPTSSQPRVRPTRSGGRGRGPRQIPGAAGSRIERADAPSGGGARIPVYAPWHANPGPQLSLGMLMASARNHDGGSLSESFELHRPETAETVLDALLHRPGPAILLCSNYLWSTERNLALAGEAARSNPQLLVVHGGPDTPKYEADAESFLRRHPDAAHLLVRGEGEQILVQLLEHLAGTPTGSGLSWASKAYRA